MKRTHKLVCTAERFLFWFVSDMARAMGTTHSNMMRLLLIAATHKTNSLDRTDITAWLCEHLPPDYITEVEALVEKWADRPGEDDVPWEVGH